MSKKYVKIGGYGSLVIPFALAEKIVEQGYIVSTTYNSNASRHDLSRVDPVTELSIVEYSEIETQLAQQALEGR